MPNKTTNLNLTKPLPEEFYDIGVHNDNMDKIDAALGSVSNHPNNKNNPHGVTAAQIGAQPANNNLTEYKSGVLKTVGGTEVKVSSIEISPDEPEEGDVWIDTDENYEGDSVVTSVNGKSGNVNVAPVIQWGTADVVAGSTSPYPEGTLYVVVE